MRGAGRDFSSTHCYARHFGGRAVGAAGHFAALRHFQPYFLLDAAPRLVGQEYAAAMMMPPAFLFACLRPRARYNAARDAIIFRRLRHARQLARRRAIYRAAPCAGLQDGAPIFTMTRCHGATRHFRRRLSIRLLHTPEDYWRAASTFFDFHIAKRQDDDH